MHRAKENSRNYFVALGQGYNLAVSKCLHRNGCRILCHSYEHEGAPCHIAPVIMYLCRRIIYRASQWQLIFMPVMLIIWSDKTGIATFVTWHMYCFFELAMRNCIAVIKNDLNRDLYRFLVSASLSRLKQFPFVCNPKSKLWGVFGQVPKSK